MCGVKINQPCEIDHLLTKNFRKVTARNSVHFDICIRPLRIMKIIVVSATDAEVNIAKEKINHDGNIHKIFFKTTGVGMLSTAVSLTQLGIEEKPDLLIQAGIAGCFDEKLMGITVIVKEEIIGDMGVEEDSEWKNIFDLKLEDENKFPFEKSRLVNDKVAELNLLKLPEVVSVSINEISTNKKRIEYLKEKYDASIENMEGASLHFVGKTFGINFIQLRTISNMVGERDKKKWIMKNAIESLNETLLQYIHIAAIMK